MIKDLRKKSDLELGDLISKLKVQLLEMRFKMANGQVNEVHKVSGIRKTIAMAMTVLSERNIKVSFSTHSIQLIKNDNKKQEIKAIKISSLAIDEPSSNKSTKKQALSSNEKTNEDSKKVVAKKPTTTTTKKANSSTAVSKKPTAKTSTNSNLKNSSKKQSVQIRRSAKG